MSMLQCGMKHNALRGRVLLLSALALTFSVKQVTTHGRDQVALGSQSLKPPLGR
jgi:hypothetical protein